MIKGRLTMKTLLPWEKEMTESSESSALLPPSSLILWLLSPLSSSPPWPCSSHPPCMPLSSSPILHTDFSPHLSLLPYLFILPVVPSCSSASLSVPDTAPPTIFCPPKSELSHHLKALFHTFPPYPHLLVIC